MVRCYWKKLLISLGCVSFLVLTGEAAAQNSDLQELRARLERLEKQNEELVRALREQQEIALPASSVEDPPGRADLPAGELEVHRIVRDYLKSQEEANREAAAARKGQDQKDGSVVGRNLEMNASWANGLQVTTADKAFRIHLGGRTQIDSAWVTAGNQVRFGSGGIGRFDDGVNFRRARFQVDGTMYEVIDFYCQYDFVNTFNFDPNQPASPASVANTPVPTDLWITLTHLPGLGNFRIGNQKASLGFEHLTSSRYLNFLERSLSFDAFLEEQDNGFRPGFQFFNWIFDERMTWALGVFKNNRNIFGWNVGDGEYDVTGRITWLPWYEEDGRYLLHLGIGASHRDLDDDRSNFRARTEVRNGPAALHTIVARAQVEGDSQDIVVPELVLNAGPFILQSEYYATWVTGVRAYTTPTGSVRRDVGRGFFQGGYVELLYFLTGESRHYNRRAGVFDRIEPNRNYFLVPGNGGPLFSPGAWQVGVRYSILDLDNQGINGGTIQDVTLGLNWFLNANAKVQWNYSVAHRHLPAATSNGTIQGFGMRFAYDF